MTEKSIEEIALAMKERYSECNGSYTPKELYDEILSALTNERKQRDEAVKAERERCMGLIRGSYAHPLGTTVATVLNALQDAVDPTNEDTLTNLYTEDNQK